jgi:hypothetical protein
VIGVFAIGMFAGYQWGFGRGYNTQIQERKDMGRKLDDVVEKWTGKSPVRK